MPRTMALALVLVLAVTSAADGPPSPTLGRQWAPGQNGYGQVAPKTIYNGGDPTGLVRHVHWKRWGSRRAVGTGAAYWIWPGFEVADGSVRARARVIAYHLGRCKRRPSYNAITWYFPRYGEKFHPGQYINACTGDYVPHGAPHEHHCGTVTLPDGAEAREISSHALNCRRARKLVRTAPSAQYYAEGGRFRFAGYYCGTEGKHVLATDVYYQCRLDIRSVSYTLYPV